MKHVNVVQHEKVKESMEQDHAQFNFLCFLHTMEGVLEHPVCLKYLKFTTKNFVGRTISIILNVLRL